MHAMKTSVYCFALLEAERIEKSMTNKYKQSRPFPNGSTYWLFNDNFCCRCDKYSIDIDTGEPLPDNCEIADAIERAQCDDSAWPGNDIVEVGNMSHICLRFESGDTETMQSYKRLFAE